MKNLLDEALQKEDLQTLTNLLEELLTYSDEQLQDELLPYCKNLLKKYRTTFQKQYHVPKEVCIYDKPLYWVFVQVEQISKSTRKVEALKQILEYCRFTIINFHFRDFKKTNFSFDDELFLLKTADSKYQIFSIAKRANKKIAIFNLPFTCNDDYTFTTTYYKKETYLEALVMRSERRNGILLNFVRMLALIYNGLIMDDPFEIPFGFYRIIQIFNDYDLQTQKKMVCFILLSFFGIHYYMIQNIIRF